MKTPPLFALALSAAEVEQELREFRREAKAAQADLRRGANRQLNHAGNTTEAL